MNMKAMTSELARLRGRPEAEAEASQPVTAPAPLSSGGALARNAELLARHGIETERDSEAARIRQLTCFDSLTGLPNVMLFREQLDLVLRLARRKQHTVAVLLADIDDFRRLKQTLGHRRGDALVKALSQRMQTALRGTDLMLSGGSAVDRHGGMARVAGTEFAIVLSQLNDPRDAEVVARRLREAASAALTVGDVEVFPTISIGVALSNTDGETPERLLEHADLALGVAKDRGRDSTKFYDAGMDALASARLDVETGLRTALQNRQLKLAYQVRVDGRSGQCVSREALLRWQHPTRGLLAPTDFMDVAETSRLIVPIGHWVLEEACRQNRSWQARGSAPVTVGVNVSAHQVCRHDFVPSVARALELCGLAPQWLELEVTESALIMDTAGALRALAAVKELGVRLAIDDFGTGYSSLSYLRDFPFDVLKIDQSFTRRLPQDERTAAITQGIIELSRRLGMEVVAEGVETEAQRQALLGLGCVQMQGFLFSRPALPGSEMVAWRQPKPDS